MGAASAQNLCFRMSNLVRDGSTHPMSVRLSNLGGEPKLAATGLLGLISACPYAGLVRPVAGNMITHMMLPSAVIQLLHTNFPDRFGELLGADEAKLDAFWGHFRTHPAFAAHVAACPLLRDLRPAEWKRVVPLTLHEDGGPYGKRLSCNCISFNGLFGRGGEKVCQYLMASYLKQEPPTQAELIELWGPLLADFVMLATTGIAGWRCYVLFSKGVSRMSECLLGVVVVQRQ